MWEKGKKIDKMTLFSFYLRILDKGVNEIKVASGSVFIDNLFALENEKESQNDEMSFF